MLVLFCFRWTAAVVLMNLGEKGGIMQRDLKYFYCVILLMHLIKRRYKTKVYIIAFFFLDLKFNGMSWI